MEVQCVVCSWRACIDDICLICINFASQLQAEYTNFQSTWLCCDILGQKKVDVKSNNYIPPKNGLYKELTTLRIKSISFPA